MRLHSKALYQLKVQQPPLENNAAIKNLAKIHGDKGISSGININFKTWNDDSSRRRGGRTDGRTTDSDAQGVDLTTL